LPKSQNCPQNLLTKCGDYGNIQTVKSNKVEIRVLADDLMTVPKAAEALGRPKMTLYRWLEAGKIHAIKLGGILFIPLSEVERLKNQSAGSQPAD